MFLLLCIFSLPYSLCLFCFFYSGSKFCSDNFSPELCKKNNFLLNDFLKIQIQIHWNFGIKIYLFDFIPRIFVKLDRQALKIIITKNNI